MANLDLSKYGITDVKEVLHNPSYDVLFAEETKPGLEGFEKGQVTELGAVNVMTGVYTGRSPKDKFFVKNEASENSVWWTSDEYKNDNKPCTEEAWADLKSKAVKQLSGKRLFVVDTFCGANAATRMKVRFIMEVAWQAHFVTNMFIRPTAEELEAYGEPDFVCFNASKAKVDNYKELGLNSETATVFNLKTKEQVILNTWYGGEMKKGMFSIMNYMNPLRGIASMHCSANTNMEGTSSAIFFGLSGTGKTTLSTDPKRAFLRFSNSITAGGGDLSATRSLIAGNGAAIDLDEGLPCNGMVDTIAAVVADFAAVHNEPDTRPVGLAADLDTVARVAGNLTAVHGEIGAVVHTNGKTLVVHNMGSLLNRGDDTAATLVGKINHAFRGGIVADGARKCVVGAVIGIDQAARTAGTTVFNHAVRAKCDLAVPGPQKNRRTRSAF